MIWLTAYDESRAIRDVKRGQVSPSRNTCTFQTVFDSHFQFLRYSVSKSVFFVYRQHILMVEIRPLKELFRTYQGNKCFQNRIIDSLSYLPLHRTKRKLKQTKIVNFIGVRKKRAKKRRKCLCFFGKSGIKSPSYKISK